MGSSISSPVYDNFSCPVSTGGVFMTCDVIIVPSHVSDNCST